MALSTTDVKSIISKLQGTRFKVYVPNAAGVVQFKKNQQFMSVAGIINLVIDTNNAFWELEADVRKDVRIQAWLLKYVTAVLAALNFNAGALTRYTPVRMTGGAEDGRVVLANALNGIASESLTHPRLVKEFGDLNGVMQNMLFLAPARMPQDGAVFAYPYNGVNRCFQACVAASLFLTKTREQWLNILGDLYDDGINIAKRGFLDTIFHMVRRTRAFWAAQSIDDAFAIVDSAVGAQSHTNPPEFLKDPSGAPAKKGGKPNKKKTGAKPKKSGKGAALSGGAKPAPLLTNPFENINVMEDADDWYGQLFGWDQSDLSEDHGKFGLVDSLAVREVGSDEALHTIYIMEDGVGCVFSCGGSEYTAGGNQFFFVSPANIDVDPSFLDRDHTDPETGVRYRACAVCLKEADADHYTWARQWKNTWQLYDSLRRGPVAFGLSCRAMCEGGKRAPRLVLMQKIYRVSSPSADMQVVTVPEAIHHYVIDID